jgi:hypothetical protein
MFKIMLVIIAITLAGCATPVTVERVNNIVITPPPSLTKDCEITIPPTKEEYLKETPIGKETILGSYTRTLLTNAGVCNVQLANLRKWIVEQTKIFSSKKE